MKKLIAILILGLLFAIGVSAQASTGTTGYKVKNALIGFGVGSREQGDLESAKRLLTSDITGLSLIAIGGVGLGFTNFTYGYLHAYYGNITTADFWIDGMVLGLGTLVFVSGRILGIFLPDRFVINENADISMDLLDGNVSMAVQVRF